MSEAVSGHARTGPFWAFDHIEAYRRERTAKPAIRHVPAPGWTSLSVMNPAPVPPIWTAASCERGCLGRFPDGNFCAARILPVLPGSGSGQGLLEVAVGVAGPVTAAFVVWGAPDLGALLLKEG